MESASDSKVLPKEMSKTVKTGIDGFKAMDKLAESMSKHFGKIEDVFKKLSGDGSGRNSMGLGLASMTTGQKVGMGVAGVAAAAAVPLAALYAMSPNTSTAVAQRMSADTVAGLSGMSTSRYIRKMNTAVGNGATSAGGPAMAGSILAYSGGYLPSTLSSKNVMSVLGGLSAMSGGSNQQVAQALSGVNAMNFLRMGVAARDRNGNLKNPTSIINSVYNSMYGGRKITAEQAMMVNNPGSKGYANLQMISGGDQGLFNLLSSGMVARANNGKALTNKQMGDAQGMLTTMGFENGSPTRANFKFSTANNKMLQNTESGLVGGYTGTLGAASSVTSGLADMAQALGPVTQGLMGLKGVLQTLPGTGGFGQMASGLGGMATSIGMMALGSKMIGASVPGGGGFKAMSFGKGAKFGLAGLAIGLGTSLAQSQIKSSGGKRAAGFLGGAAGGAVMGASIGAAFGGIGAVPGAIAGGLIGGLIGGLPSYSDGTERVTHDQVAKIHEGEMVLTKEQANKVRANKWAKTFLGQVDAPVTKDNMRAMTQWMAWESGWGNLTGKYNNPLNTGYGMDGSRTVPGNKHGVQMYKSRLDGATATANTLLGKSADARGYTAIVNAFQSGTSSAHDTFEAIRQSSWVSGKVNSNSYKPLDGPSSVIGGSGGSSGTPGANSGTPGRKPFFSNFFSAIGNAVKGFFTKDADSYGTSGGLLTRYRKRDSRFKSLTSLSSGSVSSFISTLDGAKVIDRQIRVPSYAVGTSRVPEDQIAQVHKDEMIIPAKAAAQIRAGGSGGSNINITMNVNIQRASMQEAENMFRQFKERLAQEARRNGLAVY